MNEAKHRDATGHFQQLIRMLQGNGIAWTYHSHVHLREVFADPIIDRATSVILAHNHPVGDITPSREGIETTKRLRRSGEIMGITVLDHIVFNRNGYLSFVEQGIAL